MKCTHAALDKLLDVMGIDYTSKVMILPADDVIACNQQGDLCRIRIRLHLDRNTTWMGSVIMSHGPVLNGKMTCAFDRDSTMWTMTPPSEPVSLDPNWYTTQQRIQDGYRSQMDAYMKGFGSNPGSPPVMTMHGFYYRPSLTLIDSAGQTRIQNPGDGRLINRH